MYLATGEKLVARQRQINKPDGEVEHIALLRFTTVMSFAIPLTFPVA